MIQNDFWKTVAIIVLIIFFFWYWGVLAKSCQPQMNHEQQYFQRISQQLWEGR